MNFMNQQKINLLFSKLRQAIHIDYICKEITNDSYENTKKLLQELVDKGKIEESKTTKDYYVISKENL